MSFSTHWPIQWFDEIDSTNEEAKRRASRRSISNQWIAARSQTAGRGRLGRDWKSPPGNLFSTALIKWDRPISEATRIPFAAALAVADTADLLSSKDERKQVAQLKWPNDVRVNGAKLSGILVESGEGSSGRWIAAGIGINVAFVPENIGQAGTCLSELRGAGDLTVDIVLEALAERFASRVSEAIESFDCTLDNWLSRCEGLNQRIRINLDDAPIEGIFEGLGGDGALLLRLPDGELRTIRAGDVELIREV
ncbi:MAG: biotin--[acetyl-CoA-carboxylase] ligase [Pseudomonadota bacterium]